MGRLISNPARVLAFINQHMPLGASSDMKGIGWENSEGELVAGVAYENFNGRNVWMHVAAVGKNWMTREFLRYAFYYPFVEMGVDRVTGYVEASNTVSRKFQEHLGFTPEATLSGAASDGGDVVIYKMLRRDCRFITSED